MSTRIQQALSKQFEKHRIVFWYDEKRELKADFEAVSLDAVEKVVLENNAFGLKYRILREQPKQKFLIFHDGPVPAPLDNWLLDVQLAHTEFRTDQVAIWLSELELGLDFADLVKAHFDFFGVAKRRQGLKKLADKSDTHTQLRLKMLAVCANTDPRLDAILESLLQDLAVESDNKFADIQKAGLEEFLWTQVGQVYGYKSAEPSLSDFSIELYQACFLIGVEGDPKMNNEALAFLKRWKDSRSHEASFETLSKEAADVLDIETNISTRDFRELIELDYFEIIDRKIILDLVRSIVDSTVSSGDVTLWVRQRRQSHWYKNYQDLYDAIDYAAQFTQLLGDSKLEMNSLSDGIQLYTSQWYKVDQLYRKFIYHVRKSGQATLTKQLNEQIENLYSNHYLLKLNDRWQVHVDACEKWSASPIPPQRSFYERAIKPIYNKGQKVAVIISDAMRYEVADELLSLVRRENRFNVKLDPFLSSLPSYTQLGMASQLPHKALEVKPDGNVLVDGQNSSGTANRQKIIANAHDGAGAAVQAEAFMEMTKTDARDLSKSSKVLYVYHNKIDQTGDNTKSEGEVFDAAARTLDDLVKLVKRLTDANYTNIIVTADHGFIYQNRKLAESDFAALPVEGTQIDYRDRRFIIGSGLVENASVRRWTAQQLGLEGELEFLTPKSINRLRLKGSGSRFVHGGASLQEVIVPVIYINKSKTDDIQRVDVELLRSGSEIITTGQVAVTFYQSEPVNDKLHPRTMRAGIYSADGELISDKHELSFDLSSEHPREREQKVRFLLSKQAESHNGEEVILKLEEKNAKSSHYKEYKSLRYKVRRSISSDFDF